MKNTKGTSSRMYSKLITAAKEARKHAYCPHSKIKVGAAVLTQKGNIYTGSNVENASFSLSNCAERTAIFKAVSEGERKFVAVAISIDKPYTPSPCGACRQVISEFGSSIDVVTQGEKGKLKVVKISELMPNSFKMEKSK
jgi:cytidine deaminase